MTNSALRLRLNEKEDVNDVSYLTAMFGIAWQLSRQMTEKDAIKAQLANAAEPLVDVIESSEPMRAEIYAVIAEATDTAIEVFKASLGGEFEVARKNLLGKWNDSSNVWTVLGFLRSSSNPEPKQTFRRPQVATPENKEPRPRRNAP